MIKVFEINKDNRFAAKSFIVVVILMFISFNQSGIIYGLNISFADLFCLICLMLLTYNEHLLLPITPSVFFVLVSIVTVFSSVFLTPQIFDCEIELYKVFKGTLSCCDVYIFHNWIQLVKFRLN